MCTIGRLRARGPVNPSTLNNKTPNIQARPTIIQIPIFIDTNLKDSPPTHHGGNLVEHHRSGDAHESPLPPNRTGREDPPPDLLLSGCPNGRGNARKRDYMEYMGQNVGNVLLQSCKKNMRSVLNQNSKKYSKKSCGQTRDNPNAENAQKCEVPNSPPPYFAPGWRVRGRLGSAQW